MKTVLCAAVDLGATSGRVIVGEWSGAGLALREVHRFPNGFRTMAGHEYWDLPRLGATRARALLRREASIPSLPPSASTDGGSITCW